MAFYIDWQNKIIFSQTKTLNSQNKQLTDILDLFPQSLKIVKKLAENNGDTVYKNLKMTHFENSISENILCSIMQSVESSEEAHA